MKSQAAPLRPSAETLLRKNMARFVDQEIVPRAREIDEKKSFPYEVFQTLGRMGAFRIRYPRARQGGGGNCTLFCIMCEELARGSMSLAAITAMQCLMGTNFLFHYGTEDHIRRLFLPAMEGEKVAAFALTEPDAATDLAGVRTTAEKTPDGYRLNGMKTWITNAPVADFFTVLAQTDRSKGFRGMNFFLVERGTPGLSVSKKFDKLGTWATEISEIAFENCLIPKENMLGEEGRGLSNLMKILSEIRTMTAALSLGLSRAAFEASLQYAKERTQFGQSIGNFQLVQSKIANMATEIEASRLLVYNAARLVDQGVPCMKEASMAKYFASEAACRAADQATRTFGAYSYSMEYPVQRFYRDTRFLLFGGGTSEILQVIIAREFGL